MRVAQSFWARLRGLAFAPPPSEPLLIPRCRSVHTFGMRYPLDLYWLDGDCNLVRLDEDVPPRRFASCREASAVLEVPSPRTPPTAAA